MKAAEILLTVAEVAERVKCHPLTVRRWIRQGQLRAVRVGGLIRVPEAELTGRMVVAGDERGTRRPARTVARLRATMAALRQQLEEGDRDALEHLLDEGGGTADWSSPLE